MSVNNIPEANRLAHVCFNTFDSMSRCGKPVDGKEWTVLTCIAKFDGQTNDVEVVSLGTGTKCIGKQLLSPNGDILNDSHAEVMCRRGFIRYLYDQINISTELTTDTLFSFNQKQRKFELKKSVSFHLFTTHAPCGDASIFLLEMDAENNYEPPSKKQKPLNDASDDDLIGDCVNSAEENVGKSASNFTGAKLICSDASVQQDLMLQSHGAIRTKPGRGVHTLSVSCSDKMAKWNVVGVQGALLYTLLMKPIYLDSITFGDRKYCNLAATERAIWKRFDTHTLSHDLMSIQNPVIRVCGDAKGFKYEKNSNLEPSPSSIVWCKVEKYPHQVAVAGRRQGVTRKNLNTRSGRLLISKIELFWQYLHILVKFNKDLCLYAPDVDLPTIKYDQAKQASTEYQKVWQELKENYFKNWTIKPNELLQFMVDQTKGK